MGQVLHKRATTTHAVRTAIQRSEATVASLAAQYHLNPKTVVKWKQRDSVEDATMGPKRVRTVLSPADEALICAFRRKTLLPLDDCYVALRDHIPALSRSNLHRCLKRHGLSVLPVAEKEAKKKFKTYDIGYVHIDICELRTGEGKAYLYVAVDRACKYVAAELRASPTMQAAADFLERLIRAVPYKIHTVLTDNGVQFTFEAMQDKPKNKQHCFDRLCRSHGIEHRLTKVRHPWTNGQVERMNRTLKDATVKQYHYETAEQLKHHLQHFLNAYNHAKKLKALQFMTPVEKIRHQWKSKPHLFIDDPCHYSMGLNT